ncbi:hypothetical protein METBIDRAFT_227294 [Metschnikowia bicuspidata var. bicuspidata NRRL YB-4993]|uniref:TEA domain-containing protein n=1 Tax=Metschnikowia bicuspidata var. bicuspidata NRRL YB-4993 TaxID=869754 RepID=A0A1A0H1Y6_9ASCO|nr:hypothetical protein METBIDRAFT_227294 [Metschnikowia bicuspidata var. bicuspidata NRRL YB-4993]OBA18044.1 hypothetical protein METBIDRAFT_227294 [Metschnikowia bicuspidata var. bicuspidata NRRL YB-4993]
MHPETPKNSSKVAAGLTPSFTFGNVGALPSAFRFVLPRNMNLLSSLSPHRLFSRLCKNPADDATKTGRTAFLAPQPLQHASPSRPVSRATAPAGGAEVFHDAILAPFTEPHPAQNFHHESTVELVSTADSVDIWSFASDSHAASMSLTAISENADDKDVFFSPHDMFLEKSPLDCELSLSQGQRTPGARGACGGLPENTRKRVLSDPHDSPCTKIANKASAFGLPPRTAPPAPLSAFRDPKKVWTKALDDELMRCFQKYSAFKQTQAPGEALLRGSSQNKVLSRMLEKKTAVHRTPKQVSGRLLKLLKSAAPKLVVDPVAESTPLKQEPRPLPHLALPQKASQAEAVGAALDTFNMSFQYTNPNQKHHVFASLSGNDSASYSALSVEEARKRLPQTNGHFLAQFDKLAQQLLQQGVVVQNVSCDLRLDPGAPSLCGLVSPMDCPRQFAEENGSFLMYLAVTLREDSFPDAFATLKSTTTVYKGAGQALFTRQESINGYRQENKSFRFDVPFLRPFWAGVLTFVVNGSSDPSDLESLIVLQTICDDTESEKKIYGFFVYRFRASGSGNTTVEVINLPGGIGCSQDNEIDELETILATSPVRSSPFKVSPARRNLYIQTGFSTSTTPGPHSTPTFNSGLLHENNVNYEFAKLAGGAANRPAMPVSKSVSSFNFEKRPVSATVLQTIIPFNQGNRHHSAGQMGSFTQIPASTDAHGYRLPQPPYAPSAGQSPFFGGPPVMSGTPHAPVNPALPMNQMPHPLKQLYFDEQTAMHPHAASAPPPMMAHVPLQVSTSYQVPQEINSAPASQLQFFPQTGQPDKDAAKRARRAGPPLQFRTMLQYDPSKDVSSDPRKEKTQKSHHTFPAKPEVVFKSENM